MAEINFNAANVKPSTGAGDPIPLNDYRMHIVESSTAVASSGAENKILKLTLEVLDGEYKGRKVFVNLNIVNSNATAQKIAQEDLSAICHATNVMQLKDSSQLHHIPMICRVRIKAAKGEYDAQNVIKKYSSASGVVGSPTPVAAAAGTTPAAEKPAWA